MPVQLVQPQPGSPHSTVVFTIPSIANLPDYAIESALGLINVTGTYSVTLSRVPGVYAEQCREPVPYSLVELLIGDIYIISTSDVTTYVVIVTYSCSSTVNCIDVSCLSYKAVCLLHHPQCVGIADVSSGNHVWVRTVSSAAWPTVRWFETKARVHWAPQRFSLMVHPHLDLQSLAPVPVPAYTPLDNAHVLLATLAQRAVRVTVPTRTLA